MVGHPMHAKMFVLKDHIFAAGKIEPDGIAFVVLFVLCKCTVISCNRDLASIDLTCRELLVQSGLTPRARAQYSPITHYMYD
jgi:hypothetical protein